MKTKLLTAINHNTILNLGCHCGVSLNTGWGTTFGTKDLRTMSHSISAYIRMCRKFGNHQVKYGDPIDLMDLPETLRLVDVGIIKGIHRLILDLEQ